MNLFYFLKFKSFPFLIFCTLKIIVVIYNWIFIFFLNIDNILKLNSKYIYIKKIKHE